ncbi:MAG: 3'(2'),5'-bisphosphate nucleotidase [Planctomycetales bacterium]
MAQEWSRELQTAVEAVRQASLVCRAVQKQIAPEALAKKDKSPVTIADFSSQAIVGRHLERELPDDPLLAEEDAAALREGENAPFLGQIETFLKGAGIDGSPEQILAWIDRGNAPGYSPRFWTLDPIDGTKGFLRGEQYAVSLALIINGEITVAALGCPNLADPVSGATGLIFAAVKGQGATVVPLDQADQKPRSVRVSAQQNIKQARVCESVESGHSAQDVSALVVRDLGIEANPVRLDSQAKYGMVAFGGAEIYLRLPTRADYREKIWDHAGGVLIVTESGGTVTDVAGKPLDWTHGAELSVNRGVVVSNGAWHGRILEVLAQHGVK